MPRSKPDREARICDAALRLAGQKGWNAVTLEAIAKAAKISPARMRADFPGKNLILPALVNRIDRRVAAIVGKTDTRATPRDRLFEILMARFDMLQEHRTGILSILGACRRDPSAARLILPAQIRSMRYMLSLARLAPGGMHESLAGFGLLAVYYRALWCWQKDRSADMAATMAALDQALRCAVALAEIVLRGK